MVSEPGVGPTPVRPAQGPQACSSRGQGPSFPPGLPEGGVCPAWALPHRWGLCHSGSLSVRCRPVMQERDGGGLAAWGGCTQPSDFSFHHYLEAKMP